MNVIQEIENFIQKEIKDHKEQADIDLTGNLYALGYVEALYTVWDKISNLTWDELDFIEE